MSKPIIVEKENLKDKNDAKKIGAGEGSLKLLSGMYRKEALLGTDKSARLPAKKDLGKAISGLASHLGPAAVQNYNKKILASVGRGDEAAKEQSLQPKKPTAANLPATSIPISLLSRDKEIRLHSKSKQRPEEEPEKRHQQVEALQPHKSILQFGSLNPKVQAILNQRKKAPKWTKENMDGSSFSSVSEVSDVSRTQHRPADSKASEVAQAFHQRDLNLNQNMNFTKGKQNIFTKKIESITKPITKRTFSKLNKSRVGGSGSSVEHTPEPEQAATKEKKLNVTRLLINPSTLQPRDLAARLAGTTKTAKIKKEKLLCHESFVLKHSDLASTPKLDSAETLPLKAFPKRDPTIEEEISNFVQENLDQVYTSETLSYLIQSEAEYSPDPYYLDKCQNELKWKMRAVLLDWMIEVCSDFTLKISTFHYAVNYIDRYLSVVPNVQKSNFQLVGLTALNLATKLEEVYVPHLADFAVSASNLFSVETIKKMEISMMKVRSADPDAQVAPLSADAAHLGQLVHLPVGLLPGELAALQVPPARAADQRREGAFPPAQERVLLQVSLAE